MTSGSQYRMLHRSEDYALGTWGPVLLQFWNRSTPLEGARRALAAARALTLERTATLIVVADRSEMPGGGARRLLGTMPDALPGCVGLALVREGTGFRASTVRAVMTGMMMLSRQPIEHQVFATVTPAASWLVSKLQLTGGGAELAQAMDSLRTEQIRLAS